MAQWQDIASARRQWRDAPTDDEALQDLLDVSQSECELFAPAIAAELPGGEPVIPIGWRVAHLLHARAIWNFMQANPGFDGPGLEGIGGVRVYPMDANIRRRLRPDNGRPDVG